MLRRRNIGIWFRGDASAVVLGTFFPRSSKTDLSVEAKNVTELFVFGSTYALYMVNVF